MGTGTAPSPTTELSAAARWVAANTGQAVNDDLGRCIDVLCSIAAPYNLQLIGDAWGSACAFEPYRDHGDEPVALPAIEFADTWMIARLRTTLGSVDDSGLTRLVVAAHDHAVRVQIRSGLHLDSAEETICQLVDGEWVDTDEKVTWTASCLELQLNARARTGDLYSMHPSIDEHLSQLRR